MAAECENPDNLTFAIIPTEETVAELQLYKPVTDRMANLTGKKIEFFSAWARSRIARAK
jgi:ABC-type phosphate/phosphonate transport system substrate-binding protein